MTRFTFTMSASDPMPRARTLLAFEASSSMSKTSDWRAAVSFVMASTA
jgi:hypothetical protein